MNKKQKSIQLFLICMLVSCVTLFAGCQKTDTHSDESSQPARQETAASTSASSASLAQDKQSEGTGTPEQREAFDYEPGSMGAYIRAESHIEAAPEVLDSLEMTLPEGVSRVSVSECQLDFVKDGRQVGGILLADIPEEMINEAAQSEEGFQEMAAYLAEQVMPDVYPEMVHLNGGGAGIKGEYARVFVEANDKSTQYKHCIYLGEQYCYDFWTDQSWWSDSGYGIQDSLSSNDIQQERNHVEFSWTN